MTKVYEIRIRVYLKTALPQENSYATFGQFLDSYLVKNPVYLDYHKSNRYKLYCYDQFYPTEQDGIYKKDHIYTVRIRTVNADLALYFLQGLENHYTDQVKGLTVSVREISKKHIAEVYTITPAVVKCTEEGADKKSGYWREILSFEQYEERLKSNLIKKYNSFTGQKLDENFDLYKQIELTNRKPIAIPYKNITLLGDKLSIQTADNETAQEIWYFALGSGILEMNSRGMGLLNYKYL